MATRKKSTRKATGGNRGTQDAISLLKADHVNLKELLSKLESGRGSKQSLLGRITEEIRVHTSIEEEIFYPEFLEAARSRQDTKVYYEALEEHHVVDLVMSEITGKTSSSDEFQARAKVLKDLIEHHIEEEEGQMFPKARKIMGTARLHELGTELQERKSELMSAGSTRRRAA